MQLTRRFVRLLVVCLAVVGLVFLFTFTGLAFVVGSAIAFSGSSGSEAKDFIHSFLPAAHFIAGLTVIGGFVAAVNAIAVPRGVWVVSLVVSAVIGGTLALFVPPVGGALLSLGTPAFRTVGQGMFQK